MSTGERIMKMWPTQTMTFYAAAKKNEIGKFAGKWMDLGMVILREVTRTQKGDAYENPLLCNVLIFMCLLI